VKGARTALVTRSREISRADLWLATVSSATSPMPIRSGSSRSVLTNQRANAPASVVKVAISTA
jgi:hypothetical protein